MLKGILRSNTAYNLNNGAHSASQSYRSFASSSKVPIQATRRLRNRADSPHPSRNEDSKRSTAEAIADSVMKENERIRQLLLDRDGGSASVPTREGGWDQAMGRNTSKHMHRVLDQVRISTPDGDSNTSRRRKY